MKKNRKESVPLKKNKKGKNKWEKKRRKKKCKKRNIEKKYENESVF